MQRYRENRHFSREPFSLVCNFCLSLMESWESLTTFTFHMQIVCWDLSSLSTGVIHEYLVVRYYMKKVGKHHLMKDCQTSIKLLRKK